MKPNKNISTGDFRKLIFFHILLNLKKKVFYIILKILKNSNNNHICFYLKLKI